MTIARNGRLFEMTRPDVERALESGVRTAVASFGATEQHGPHLPQGTDSIWGEVLAQRVADALGRAVVVPGVRIGCSEHHMAFPGTLTFSEDTFVAVVGDICRSLAHHGFEEIVLIPTHGGNFAPLAKAISVVEPELEGVHLIGWTSLPDLVRVLYAVGEKFGVDSDHAGAHAGENETSMILALRPELVDSDRAEPGFIGDHLAQAEVLMQHGFKAVSENGVLGDPRLATLAAGRAYLDALTRAVVDLVASARSERG